MLDHTQGRQSPHLLHPPYSPDLALSDYHPFGPIKEGLRGKYYASNEEFGSLVEFNGTLVDFDLVWLGFMAYQPL